MAGKIGKETKVLDEDARLDRKLGIKPGGKKDDEIHKKMGIPLERRKGKK